MPDLPIDELPDENPLLFMINLLDDNLPYSKKNSGNVLIRAGRDEAEVEPPEVGVTVLNSTPQLLAQADPLSDQVTVSVQLDAYASSEAEIYQLEKAVDDVLRANRVSPGGKFSLALTGQWINNDSLTSRDKLHRHTQTMTLTRFIGTG